MKQIDELDENGWTWMNIDEKLMKIDDTGLGMTIVTNNAWTWDEHGWTSMELDEMGRHDPFDDSGWTWIK